MGFFLFSPHYLTFFCFYLYFVYIRYPIALPPPPLYLAAPGRAASTYRTIDICLQKKPEDRFQTAAALVQALEQALQAEGDATSIALTPSPPTKRPFPFGWLYAAAILIIAIIGIIYGSGLQLPEPIPIAISTRIAIVPTNMSATTLTAATIVLPTLPESTATIAPTATPTPTAIPTTTPTETPTTTPLTTNNSQLTIDNSLTPTRPPITTSDVTAVYLASPPQIDGDLSDWPLTMPILSAFLIHQDPAWDGTEDLIVTWQLGWDQSYLYLIAIVTDDVHVQTQTGNLIFKGDSVDIQVDANREDGLAHWAADVFQITFSPGNFQTLPPSAFRWQGDANNRAVAVSADSIQLRAQPTTAGYNLEAAIPWSDLSIMPATGLQIGLALNATDNDTPDTAVQEIFLSNVSARRLLDPTTWGTLTLQDTDQ